MHDDANLQWTWIKSFGLLLLRMHAGLSIASAGFDKIPVTWFGDQVAELGFPLPTFFAWAAVLAEFVGGALLVLGLYTRFAAAFLTVTMGVAAFAFHKVTPLLEPQIAQLYFFVFLMFLFTGSGWLSLDRWLALGRDAGARWRTLLPMLILIALGTIALVKTSTASSNEATSEQPPTAENASSEATPVEATQSE